VHEGWPHLSSGRFANLHALHAEHSCIGGFSFAASGCTKRRSHILSRADTNMLVRRSTLRQLLQCWLNSVLMSLLAAS
jgi:hypothetical protein